MALPSLSVASLRAAFPTGASLAAAAVAAVSWESLAYLYTLYLERMRIPRMVRRFLKGPSPKILRDSSQPVCILRHEELARLRAAISPCCVALGSFFLVTGPSGSGLSALARRAAVQGGPGVVYINVNVTNPLSFGVDLAERVAFKFDEQVSLWRKVLQDVLNIDTGGPPEPPEVDVEDSVLFRVWPYVKRAAARVNQLTGRPAVIVVDGFEALVESAPQLVSRLLLLAKEAAAEGGALSFVFVAPFGPAVTSMLASPARSNMQLVRIGDVTKADAITLLTADLPVSFGDAERVWQRATGGRLCDLMAARALFLQRRSVDCVLAEFEVRGSRSVGFVGLSLVEVDDPDDMRLRICAWQVLRTLLDAPRGEIAIADFQELVRHVMSLSWRKIVGSGVIVLDPTTATVSIHCRATRTYVGDVCGEPWSDKRAAFDSRLRLLEEKYIDRKSVV